LPATCAAVGRLAIHVEFLANCSPPGLLRRAGGSFCGHPDVEKGKGNGPSVYLQATGHMGIRMVLPYQCWIILYSGVLCEYCALNDDS